MTLLRAASPTDAPAIATILSDWIDETDWMPRFHTRVEDQGHGRFLIEKTDVVVAEVDARVAGFLARRDTEIDALYIASTVRGFGIGPALLDAAKRECKRLELWTFQSNTRARAFYAREGFEEAYMTDGARNDEKLPDVRMIWTAEVAT